MNQELFDETLLKTLRRKPFSPFQVELLDGKVIVVDQPVVMVGGAASFISSGDELIEFACEEVRDIRLASAEAAS